MAASDLFNFALYDITLDLPLTHFASCPYHVARVLDFLRTFLHAIYVFPLHLHLH
jgi:hypothetical protein